ncbi:CRISPR-associated endonuclease Cas1 [Nitrosopumilus ureiphilus]|uniref:CRISPR-associated endonuclease Cas1 n=1 Tax=Nitrosopumilus ureiphilus TaxID=1470067 RepID=UPI001FE698A8|nr:CRISPR-associated endonuclease Cas1 [Nitrosopumilus ureiphilus]
MTIQGKNNHYNIKLRGYGHSISVKNSKLILKNGRQDITGEQESESWFVKNMPYEKIILSGKGYVSTEALSLLSQNNRNVILVDTYGKPVTYCNSMMDSLTGTKYRIAQYDTFRDPEKCEYLTKQILTAKKESQLKLLRLIGSDITSLPEKENSAGRVYFKEFGKFIPERYGFNSRNNHSYVIPRTMQLISSMLC